MANVRPSERGRSPDRSPLTAEEIAFRVAWITTGGLIALTLITLLLPNVVAAAFNAVILWILVAYVGVQWWATLVRKLGMSAEWAADNALAFVGVVAGVIILTQSWFWTAYSGEHHVLMMKYTVAGLFDLVFGLANSLRIAESTKGRDES